MHRFMFILTRFRGRMLGREVLDASEIGGLFGPSVYQLAKDLSPAGAAQVASIAPINRADS